VRRFAPLYDALDRRPPQTPRWRRCRLLRPGSGADARGRSFPHRRTAEASDRARSSRPGLRARGRAGWLFESHSVAGTWRKPSRCSWTPSARDGRPARAALALQLIEDRLLPLRDAPEEENSTATSWLWEELERRESSSSYKLLTGELAWASPRPWPFAPWPSMPVSPATVAHRLMAPGGRRGRIRRPGRAGEQRDGRLAALPVFLASQLEDELPTLGDQSSDWLASGSGTASARRSCGVPWPHFSGRERRADHGQVPRSLRGLGALPEGTVLDGAVLAFSSGAPMPFSVLQRRIGRQKLSRRFWPRPRRVHGL